MLLHSRTVTLTLVLGVERDAITTDSRKIEGCRKAAVVKKDLRARVRTKSCISRAAIAVVGMQAALVKVVLLKGALVS
jgi:hypothetical protein